MEIRYWTGITDADTADFLSAMDAGLIEGNSPGRNLATGQLLRKASAMPDA
jgi:hypothetical protein